MKSYADEVNDLASGKLQLSDDEVVLQAYVVANKRTKNERRELIFMGIGKKNAINHIKNAIASGFDYGYIKRGTETIAYLTEKSFLRPI